VKHSTHSSTDFDPATSTLLAGVSTELGLGIGGVKRPQEGKDVFYFRGTAYAPRTDAAVYTPRSGSGEAYIGEHPEKIIEKCVEAFFLDYPEERSRPPFASERLRETTLEDMLREYAASESQVHAALAYSGFDTFVGSGIDGGASASLASFIGSFPFQREPTHRLTEGTRSLSARMLAAAGVEVRHGWQLDSLEMLSEQPGDAQGDKRLVFTTTVAGEEGDAAANSAAKNTCHAGAVVLAVPPSALQRLSSRSQAAAAAAPENNTRAWAPHPALAHIVPVPALKLWLKWRRPWWTRLGLKTGSLTSSELSGARRVTYHDSAVLAVHITGQKAVRWRDRFETDADAASRALVADLRRTHGVDEADLKKVPDLPPSDPASPPNLAWNFWDDATSSWGLGSDAYEAARAVQRGIHLSDRVHVCGAALAARAAGTIEGALRSATSLLRYFGSGAMAWDAVCAGDLSLLQGAIVRGADEEHVDVATGMTLLHRACGNGFLEIAELLLSRGARVGARDANGATPLHYACVSGHPDIVELLLSNDADIFATDMSGATPMDVARLQGHSKVLATLSTRHLLRHWNRLNSAPPCQVPLAPIPGMVNVGDEDEAVGVLQQLFQKFDLSGEGSVPVGSLGALAAELGEPMSADELADMRAVLDPMGANKVDFQDFFRFWTEGQ
jgi:hypothetical protein